MYLQAQNSSQPRHLPECHSREVSLALQLLIGPGSMTLAGGGEQREAGPGRAFFLTAGSGGWGAHTALATAVFLVF